MGREIGPGDGMGNGMNAVGAARASIWSNGVFDQLGLNQRGACVSILRNQTCDSIASLSINIAAARARTALSDRGVDPAYAGKS